MARALAAQGCDVSLVCAGSTEDVSSPPDDADRGDNGVAIVRIPVAGNSKLRRTIQFVAGADGHCRNAGYDIVHAVTPCFSCNVYQPRGGTYVETVRRSIELAGSPV